MLKTAFRFHPNFSSTFIFSCLMDWSSRDDLGIQLMGIIDQNTPCLGLWGYIYMVLIDLHVEVIAKCRAIGMVSKNSFYWQLCQLTCVNPKMQDPHSNKTRPFPETSDFRRTLIEEGGEKAWNVQSQKLVWK